MSVYNLMCTLVNLLNAPKWFPNKCYCFHSKIISNGVHCGMYAPFECTTWLLSVIKSSLSKRIINLYHLYPNNSIKTRKQIDCNAYLLGEATVSEWIWVSFHWIQSSPLQTLVQYEQTRYVGLIQSVRWLPLSGAVCLSFTLTQSHVIHK